MPDRRLARFPSPCIPRSRSRLDRSEYRCRARIFKEGASVEQVVASFFGVGKAPAAIEFLRLTDVVIRELLYIEEFAREKLSSGVCIPPLLHVYWDSLFINQPVRRVLSHFVHDPEEAIRAGEAAFTHFDRMLELARQIGLPKDDLLFMRDTSPSFCSPGGITCPA